MGGLGVRNDSASDLIYMRHRWYDVSLGRFISRDPIGHGQDFLLTYFPQKAASPNLERLRTESNLYSYARVSPINFGDPDGLSAVCYREFMICLENARTQFRDLLKTRREEIQKGAPFVQTSASLEAAILFVNLRSAQCLATFLKCGACP